MMKQMNQPDDMPPPLLFVGDLVNLMTLLMS